MGSILLFSNMMVHRSYENMSDKIRWSMDLRYTVGDELSKLTLGQQLLLIHFKRRPRHPVSPTMGGR